MNDIDKQQIYRDEKTIHQRGYRRLVSFTHSTTRAAIVMLVAAIAAIIVANSPMNETVEAFWETPVYIGFGNSMSAALSVREIINDILMAVFFLLVGLEIKYEMTVGELTNIRQALLPICAAIGGVCAPIIIYTLFNMSNPETSHGWGVPTATDIAFALGILSLLGNRVPPGVRVFLSTLAVADDILAIIIIAVFYGQSPDAIWLFAAAIIMALLVIINRRHVYYLGWYLVLGAILWFCIFQSGIHSSIAGVLLAFTIPTGSRVAVSDFAHWSREKAKLAHQAFTPDEPVMGQSEYLAHMSSLGRVSKQVVPPAIRLEKSLYPWVYFIIMPLFALANAGVCIIGIEPSMLIGDTVFLGVALGLLIGKPAGILAMSLLVVKTKRASLPENVSWQHMIGAAILGGVGFTMAIFVSGLAFAEPYHITVAKTAILCASAVAGAVGFFFLYFQAKLAAKENKRFFQDKGDIEFQQTGDAEDTIFAIDENLVDKKSND